MKDKPFIRRNIFTILGTAVLVLFTVYALLDTFVIVKTYSAVEPRESTVLTADTEESAETEQETSSPVVTDNSYSDGDISVTITEYRVSDTTVYVADVTLSSPEYLLTALAGNVYGRNIKDETSSIASDNGAILAVNGDFYGSRNTGYVIRNGVLYRSVSGGCEDLVVWSDGSFGIIDENEVSAEELLGSGAVQVFSFGPALVTDGEVSVDEGDEVGRAMASNPRTAIAYVDEGHYLFIVSDGRTDESEGLNLRELAEFAKSLGAVTCYNLDGGGSSTMYFMGEVVNNPTTSGRGTSERSVSDIVYVGK